MIGSYAFICLTPDCTNLPSFLADKIWLLERMELYPKFRLNLSAFMASNDATDAQMPKKSVLIFPVRPVAVYP